MNYERITRRDWKENMREHRCIASDRALTRLGELEDKIENGTLIELPCKVGDFVYQIINWNFIQTVTDVTVVEISVDVSGTFIKAEHNYLKLTDYNKTWFTDKELAEKRLKEMKNVK